MVTSRHTATRPEPASATDGRQRDAVDAPAKRSSVEPKAPPVVLAAALLCSPLLILLGGALDRLGGYIVALAVLVSFALALIVRARVAGLATEADVARRAARAAMVDADALAAERREAKEELRRQALHDPLTALPNRTLFLDRLTLAVDRASLRGTSAAVLFCDLDHFKLVNDSLGHAAGDAVLTQLARRLSDLLRPGETVARFGGDEFTVLSEDLVSEEQALSAASRVADAIRAPIRVSDTEVHMTASIGIAMSPQHSDRPDRLLQDAEAAMYLAKEQGRDHHAMFEPAERDRSTARLRMESDLRRAISENQLLLHYQPTIDLRARHAVVGVEALLRWRHPSRGLVAPEDFVPIAEETGLIEPIGRWVLTHACRQVAEWDRSGEHGYLMVAVNLSARQLLLPDTADVISSVLDDSGVDAARLCLEITETALLSDLESSVGALRTLKDLGVGIAIDDFGTGYSSLSYLKQLPVDIVKIDRSFVGGLGSNRDDRVIVESVISLAHSLGLVAIAEGVETAEQLAELTSLDCDLAQGFYLARPAAAANIDLTAAVDAPRPRTQGS